ncbi:MAG: dTDP-glucose 4,6-dehydratase [Bacteroidales bacterium]|nr:dTDP-glucose 4,6-dehydratase [Candidatus Latescibacterota bacterium]
MRTWLVTGAAGFIGSNFLWRVIQRNVAEGDFDAKVVLLDSLTYAGHESTFEEQAKVLGKGHFVFCKGDICDAGLVANLMQTHNVSSVVNFAAESHVDRSILGAAPFVQTNVVGTSVLLGCFLEHLDKGVDAEDPRFLQISTDEVYGSLDSFDPPFTETTLLHPNSPYSASKVGADMLVSAFHETHGLPTLITRCSNNYGPYQMPEKLIPLIIAKIHADEQIPVYGDGMNVRDWIHVADHTEALMRVMERGRVGEVYNIGAEQESTNLEIVRALLQLADKPDSLIEFVEDRKGHDFRYAIDNTKIRQDTGWRPRTAIMAGLEETYMWYVNNPMWWRPLLKQAAL